MPLSRISVLRGQSGQFRRAVADGVQRAIVECFSVDAGNQFQLIDEYDPENLIYSPDYMGIERTTGIVIVQILVIDGRSIELKERLFAAIARNLAADPGVRPSDVLITLHSNEVIDWSDGDGLAQLYHLRQAQGDEPTKAGTPRGAAPS